MIKRSMGPEDEISKLIARVSLKDRTAFNRLYTLASPKLYGVCLRLLSNRSEAEDAMQDVFVKIWNKADRYRPTEASAMGWLCAITRNHCIDRLRARSAPTKPIHDAFDIADLSAGPEEKTLNADDKRRIDICMEELDPDKALAVRAAYVEGYSYAELSDKYNVPLNTMRTWLRRSLIKLRKCLDNE